MELPQWYASLLEDAQKAEELFDQYELEEHAKEVNYAIGLYRN